MSPLAHPLPWLRDAGLAAAFAWALVRLLAGGLDAGLGAGLDFGLAPLAGGLAGLAGTALFLFPRALDRGLDEAPLGTAAGLALAAFLAALAALGAAPLPHPGLRVGALLPPLLLAGPMALALAAAGDGLRALVRDASVATAWALFLLVLLCTAPLWLLPPSQAEAPGPLALDALVAANPLTHLAIMSGTDYLRSDWFYRHCALGSLRYAYPAPAAVIGGYLLISGAWLAARVARGRRPRSSLPARLPTTPKKEIHPCSPAAT